jgi:hypothetical protein
MKTAEEFFTEEYGAIGSKKRTKFHNRANMFYWKGVAKELKKVNQTEYWKEYLDYMITYYKLKQ